MDIGTEAVNVFMGLPDEDPVLELTYNHGVDSYDLGTGYNHIALAVEDLDGTLEGLAGDGIEPEKPPYRPGGRTEGPRIALRARSRRLPRRAHRTQRLRPLRLNHLALTVSDPAASAAFYRENFGFDQHPPRRRPRGALAPLHPAFGRDTPL